MNSRREIESSVSWFALWVRHTAKCLTGQPTAGAKTELWPTELGESAALKALR